MYLLKLIVFGALTLSLMVILLTVVFAITVCIAIKVTGRKVTKKVYYNYDNISQIKKESPKKNSQNA